VADEFHHQNPAEVDIDQDQDLDPETGDIGAGVAPAIEDIEADHVTDTSHDETLATDRDLEIDIEGKSTKILF